MQNRPVLYLGDTSLDGAAGYLAGLLTHWQIGYDYLPSDVAASEGLIDGPRKLFILSDYPSTQLSGARQRQILEAVEQGAGLLMIGGWESYCGQGGDWAGTAIGDALPVEISTEDDRINWDQPALLKQVADHPVVAGLPWEEHPPVIGGFNRLTAKDGAEVVLEIQRFTATCRKGQFQFTAKDSLPGLVFGTHGQGRTASLATDVAPHWVGGLVDWGPQRVSSQAEGSWAIEVGSDYARLLEQLVRWVGRIDA